MPATVGRTVVDGILDVVASLQRNPATALEVSIELGNKVETVRGHMACMAAKGLIVPAGTQWRQRGTRPIIWRWRPAQTDADGVSP